MAGRYRLAVSAPGYVTHERNFHLAAGSKKSKVVELREYVPLTGRIVDTFGRQFDGAHIYLLREGESHPANERAGVRGAPLRG